MRLTDLDPRWVTIDTDPERPGMERCGISFDCPHCKTQRLAVLFTPPLDGSRPTIFPGSHIWTRVSGNTFETLTLTPSVDVSAHGHWHGFITNGEVR